MFRSLLFLYPAIPPTRGAYAKQLLPGVISKDGIQDEVRLKEVTLRDLRWPFEEDLESIPKINPGSSHCRQGPTATILI